MNIAVIAGARPNFMKIAPLVRAFKHRNFSDFGIIHTGQHYDYQMSRVFFEELELPEPDYFLNAGSGTHAEQTARVMIEFEKVCLKEEPQLVIVVGDVNSTLACCIVAKKQNIRVAHIEAGLRSQDMTMPEEINRILTDSIADLLFVSERSGVDNLRREGKRDTQIFFVGNVMIDNLYYHLNKLKSNGIIADVDGAYAVVTLHRPSNVDNFITLGEIIEALREISRDLPLYFPAHPRTLNNLETFNLMRMISGTNIKLIPPLSYIEFLKLWKGAAMVLTDSGGIQEETTALGIPCLTIRDNTERPITIEEGSNILAGNKKNTILDAYNKNRLEPKSGRVPLLWDGEASRRIVNILMSDGVAECASKI